MIEGELARDQLAGRGGERLALAMRRRGWSSSDVARRCGGTVSASSVLAYQRGQTLPSPSSALAVAAAFGREVADELLRAWGFDDMAAAVAERVPEEVPATTARYTIESGSAAPTREVPLGWRFSGEVVGKVETSGGASYIVRLDTGTLLIMRPVFALAGSGELLSALAEDGSDLGDL